MKIFYVDKRRNYIYILMIMLAFNALIIAALFLADNYVLNSILKVFLALINVNMLYYLFLFFTMKYKCDDEKIYITALYGIKKVIIPFDSIKCYEIKKGIIKGVKLSGMCNGKFALGRSVIDKIGVTRMFATTNNIFYLCTDEINYALSPSDSEQFAQMLKKHNITLLMWEKKYTQKVRLYKEKRFVYLLLLISLIIIIMTLNPLILYLKHVLPATMPLAFSSSFKPIVFGTSKQFAFKQIVYGALNMIILFCMYYASYFHAKYDKKSSYIYMYITLAVTITFFIMQLQIIYIYG